MKSDSTVTATLSKSSSSEHTANVTYFRSSCNSMSTASASAIPISLRAGRIAASAHKRRSAAAIKILKPPDPRREIIGSPPVALCGENLLQSFDVVDAFRDARDNLPIDAFRLLEFAELEVHGGKIRARKMGSLRGEIESFSIGIHGGRFVAGTQGVGCRV